MSAYETNRNVLLSNFTSETEFDFGYHTSSAGEGPDTVYLQGLCQADVEPDTCWSCFNNATTDLPKLDPSFSYSFNNPEDAKDAASYTRALQVLMEKLRNQASGGRDDYKVAVGSETSDKSETVYGLAQCMPDLSQKDCNDCLQNAVLRIRACCLNKVGGRVIELSCNLRFEKIQFYDDI
ncbi:cysteine-rich repeat secretory protein 29-like [Neltuma alba]|uniref:cysteine-rich repeat secretory protein 29-like n=1 Tax=Neltuma alba TaxID=207710 RepID=UPI0010A2D408|nr:cysteine-rich repeat secretory protein 29-like [Prosopis alba]XP_028774283.1 cysteine-rich repeat secretory protein 29-like [Prosopis alba]